MKITDPQHKYHKVFCLGVLKGKEGGKAPAIITGILSEKLRKGSFSAYIRGFGRGAGFTSEVLKEETRRTLSYFDGAYPGNPQKVAAANQENGKASDLQCLGVSPQALRQDLPSYFVAPVLQKEAPLSRKQRRELFWAKEDKRRAKLALPEPCPAKRQDASLVIIRRTMRVVGGFNNAKG